MDLEKLKKLAWQCDQLAIDELIARLEDAEKQRDELLKAVNLIYSWANNWDSEFMNDPEWKERDYPRIQSVIASIKESQSE